LELNVNRNAEGSALIRCGHTHVLVTASVENRVPPFRAGKGGWVTAEYGMLPRATLTRTPREAQLGRIGGRTAEIQRLVGRSLRAAVDLDRLGERTVLIDCDVLLADAGTRTASITAGWAALVSACATLYLRGELSEWPIREQIAAVSVGLLAESVYLDLDAEEDQRAAVDLNVVATASGDLVEIQGTAEGRPFHQKELEAMLDVALKGIQELVQIQRRALAETLSWVAERRQRTSRNRLEPRSERTLWGPPSPKG
jgi:ribonuclease PH